MDILDQQIGFRIILQQQIAVRLVTGDELKLFVDLLEYLAFIAIFSVELCPLASQCFFHKLNIIQKLGFNVLVPCCLDFIFQSRNLFGDLKNLIQRLL